MEKLKLQLSGMSTKMKMLIPIILLSLMGAFASGCTKKEEPKKEPVKQEKGIPFKEYFDERIINMEEGVYVYPGYDKGWAIGEMEIALAGVQLLKEHPGLKITATIRGGFRSNGGVIFFTEEKVPCPCTEQDSTHAK